MNKLIAALVATVFSLVAFVQPASAAVGSTATQASPTVKKDTAKKAKKAKKMKKAASAA